MKLKSCLVLGLPPFSFFAGVLCGSFNLPQFLAGSGMFFVEIPRPITHHYSYRSEQHTMQHIGISSIYYCVKMHSVRKEKELIFQCNTLESLIGNNLNQEVCFKAEV